MKTLGGFANAEKLRVLVLTSENRPKRVFVLLDPNCSQGFLSSDALD